MPLQIVRQDITKMQVDAIVNAANPTLLGGGGVDGAIHRAAGPQLLAECRTLDGCRTGEAKLTRGYDLPAGHVIHTVGPVWRGGGHQERELLTACYRNSLQLAADNGFETVAFPMISAGIYGYPKEEAFAVAEETIRAFLEEHPDMTVYLTIFGRGSFVIASKKYADIQSFIDDRYVQVQEKHDPRRMMQGMAASTCMNAEEGAVPAELSRALEEIDESFTQMLLRKIDERGMTDVQCYKKANIDRKLFSKIRSDVHYHPRKTTALALAVALELSMAETEELLRKAGYVLSHSSKADIILEYYIRRGEYDIFAINEALFAFDQPLIGG